MVIVPVHRYMHMCCSFMCMCVCDMYMCKQIHMYKSLILYIYIYLNSLLKVCIYVDVYVLFVPEKCGGGGPVARPAQLVLEPVPVYMYTCLYTCICAYV